MSKWSLGICLCLCLLSGPDQEDAPRVGLIGLGYSPSLVRARLGQPDRSEQSLGMRFWVYDTRGLTVIWKEDTVSVHGLVASRAQAGEVRRVKVGDGAVTLRRAWGLPARVRQDGRFLDHVGAGWVLSAEVQGKRVVQITLMAAAAPTH